MPSPDTIAAMGRQWIECVMNVSEGRRAETLDAIGRTLQRTPGTHLLSVSTDWDHHRSVFSFIAPPDRIGDACFAAIDEAVQRIDLRRHQGVHPRIGAADVVPLIPLGNVPVARCVKLARSLAEKVWSQLGVPVYLYEQAALRPERRNLAAIRRGGFEALRELVQSDPGRRPDFGEPRLHPAAGASVIGVRGPLVAWNVFLATPDLDAAREIARRIRERDGGLPGVKALGFLIAKRNQSQVSMNLTDFRRTSPAQAFQRIVQEARDLGVAVAGSEIIGHVPREALPPGVEKELRVENFYPGMILEERIRQVLDGRD